VKGKKKTGTEPGKLDITKGGKGSTKEVGAVRKRDEKGGGES